MKKIILFFAAVMMTAGVLSAQDLKEATDLHNAGAVALQNGEFSSAIEYLNAALGMAEALGEEGAEIVGKSKNYICMANLGLAKGLFNDKNYAEAAAAFAKAQEIANAYGETDAAEEAAGLITQSNIALNQTEGIAAMRQKNYPAAIAAFNKVLEIDPANGIAALYLGDSYYRSKDYAKAIEALEIAKANGQEAKANKSIINSYGALAQLSNKAKKYQEAIDYATKSIEVAENANAYKYMGNAYVGLKKNAEAETAFLKYIELSPKAKDKNEILFTIGVIYHQAQNNAKAKEYYEQLVNDPKRGAEVQGYLKNL